MTKEMTNEQIKNFKKIFRINDSQISKESKTGKILTSIIERNMIEVDEKLLKFKDFETFFYCKSEEWKKTNNELHNMRENIKENVSQFHYVHGHGKNGKSTFIRKLKDKLKDDCNIVELNFKSFDTIPDAVFGFRNRIIEFFLNLSKDHEERLNDILYEICEHWSKNQISNPFQDQSIRDYNSLFETFNKYLCEFISNITKDASSLHPKATLFREKFKDFCEENKSRLSTEELFLLYLIADIKLNIADNQKKNIIIFENIDDVLTHLSEYISKEIIIKIHYYFCEVFPYYLNEQKALIAPTVLNNLHFVFVYRTANYLSAMFSICPAPSVQDRNEYLIEAPKYVINSKELSIDIFIKKLDFYEIFCEKLQTSPNAKCQAYKNILQSFKNEMRDAVREEKEGKLIREEKFISRLWNGNNIALTKCIVSILSQISDENQKILSDIDCEYFVKRGFLFFYITKYYSELRRNGPNSPLFEAFQYIWDINPNKDKCSLLRLFLTFIINTEGIENCSENKDLYGNGAGLFDIFELFSKLGYDRQDFLELFEIFSFDIDKFDYFITCLKNTDIENGNEKKLGKKYDFTKELNIFFDKKTNRPKTGISEAEKEALNLIRLYASPNSLFFLDIIKKHFEFTSCLSNKGRTTTPLTFNLKIKRRQESKEFEIQSKKVISEISFNNEIFIKQTFTKTQETTSATVKYYLKHFKNKYSPAEYCNNTKLTLKNRFFFGDIISKHITYLDLVRYELINKRILYTDETNTMNENDIVREINIIFTYWIGKYIELYNSLYEQILKAVNYSMDKHSISTYESFKILLQKIENIQNNNFIDTITKISTK